MDIEVELLCAEEGVEDLGYRGCDRAMRSGIFRMVRRDQKRAPAKLLDRRWVVIVIPRDRSETVGSDRRWVDGGDWSPE